MDIVRKLLPVILIAAACSPASGRVGVEVYCELAGADIASDLASYTFSLYYGLDEARPLADVQDELCVGWDQAMAWSPGAGTLYSTETGTDLAAASYTLALAPGRWAFVFTALGRDDPRDLARGCLVTDLASGPNPQLHLRIREILWPDESMCGDAAVDADELCDDGNVVDDATCSADCLSMPLFQVNAVTDNAQLMPSLAGAAGTYLVAWTSGGSEAAGEDSRHVRARLLDLYGRPAPIGSETGDVRLNSASTVFSQEQPAAALGADAFLTLWLDTAPSAGDPPGDVVWRLVDLETGEGGPEETLHAGDEGGQAHAGLAGNGGSSFLAAWTRGSPGLSRAACAFFNASTGAWSAADDCSAGASNNEKDTAAALAPDGRAAAAWVRGTDIILQLFDASGSRSGGDVRVNVPPGGTNDHPAAAFDGQGRLLVVWRHVPMVGGVEIRARLFGADGRALSMDFFTVSTTPLEAGASAPDGSPNYVPSVAGDPAAGLFLVVWNAPAAGGVRARIVLGDETFGINRFAGGAPDMDFASTDDFAVTEEEHRDMGGAAAACAAPDMCMVVWHDESLAADPSSKGIRGTVVPVLQP
jgi:cysteine-rich repeat protein